MTLCDTGPLVALIDQSDRSHARCVSALQGLPPSPLITTWACLTEAMYLLGRAGGFAAQDELWGFCADDLVKIHAAEEAEWQRMRLLMRQYADTPMDLADASLVAAAEELGVRRVFTLDSHFRAYRLFGREAFDIVP